jgi:hypothetical protein
LRILAQKRVAAYSDQPGRPPLLTRLMAGLAILKHTHDLSDESPRGRWLENQTPPKPISFLAALPTDGFGLRSTHASTFA